MGSLLISGGTVVDPATGRHGAFDVLVADGRVAAVAEPGTTGPADVQIDASGCWVTPGLIDMHVHLREPGYEYKETVLTGAQAAVAGGFTAVACMANTDPVNDTGAVTKYIVEKAAAAQLARVYPIGAVSVGLKGERLAEIGEMREAGIVAVSDDGKPIMDSALMRRALEYSAMFGLAVIAHEEDRALAADGCMNEGPTAFRLGLKGVPAAAEEAMVARDIALLEHTGGRLHIAHASTAGTVDLVRRAKARGLAVTVEATPHHFTLTEEAVGEYDTNAKMNPPLRQREDVEALIAALRDGTIDAIASDHAPHHRDEKDVEFECAAHGIVGLETALALSLALVRDHGLDIDTLVRAMSLNPARILGVPGGSLAVGTIGDVTVIDPNVAWEVDPESFRSKSRNTPFAAWALTGQARTTVVGGEVKWQASPPLAAVRTRSAAR
ncbi:MAG TPA: dihydroorotase [Candidatus Dormibacteraeota bacterium]|nr:dihydroorotase [Candidatus Dormibacteraeota bacterium]